MSSDTLAPEDAVLEVTMPAGTYYLGDPCYPLDGTGHWRELLATADSRGNILLDTPRGRILGFTTHHGDGVYRDQDGREFGVDGGRIGLVPQALLNEPGCALADILTSLGHLITLNQPAPCTNDHEGGTLTFGAVVIRTGPGRADDPTPYDWGRSGDTADPGTWDEDGEEDSEDAFGPFCPRCGCIEEQSWECDHCRNPDCPCGRANIARGEDRSCEVDDCDRPAAPCECGAAHCPGHPHIP